MECEKIRERLSSFLEGELDPSEEGEIRDHVASCLPCSRDLEGLRKTIHRLHDLDEVDVPGDFLEGIRKKMESRNQALRPGPKWYVLPISFRLPLQAAAMVAVVLIAVYVARMTTEKDVPPVKEITRESRLPQEETKAGSPPKTGAQKDVLVRQAPEPAVKSPVGRYEVKEGSPAGSLILEDLEKKAEPAQKLPEKQEEITLRFANRDRAVSLLGQLARRFKGEIMAEEGDVLLVSLPDRGVEGFMAGLKEGVFRLREDEVRLGSEVAGGLSASPGVSPGPSGKLARGKAEATGESTPERENRVVIRVHLVHE